MAEWRAQAEAKGWSLRQTVIETSGTAQTFIGSPTTVAEALNHHVQEDAADGFVLVPHLTPAGWTTSSTGSSRSSGSAASSAPSTPVRRSATTSG